MRLRSPPGTLSYAAALGKPVILHALLARPGAPRRRARGVITPFGDVDAISKAAIDLLSNPDKAYGSARKHLLRYSGHGVEQARRALCPLLLKKPPRTVRVIDLRSGFAQNRKTRPAPSLEGVQRNEQDSCGMMQHSIFNMPDRRHGYCVDDNARALMLMHKLPGPPTETTTALSNIYAAFVQYAWNDDTGSISVTL